MYLFKSISGEIKSAKQVFKHQTKTKRLVLAALFASIAAVLQAAGGFIPVLGYFISPFATAPILLCSMLSLPLGAMAYFLTNLLLVILQPSELFVFPFTTGLLGLGTGFAFYFFKKRLTIIAVGAAFLTLGILILLSVFNFPVLGPAVSTSFSLLTTGVIFLFSFIYNWIWVDMGIFFLKRAIS
ncbi:hypothetical protein KW850_09170 [Bacillus sp. sid0103]|uniref:hypothetical protein n=1 Tax=Bacillus sp. sid0103 TaxID=2856337 RepID=UPI001C44F4BD|nr:hypothetical protein [Bacillus sp. sid0103]MBV7505423.1 hypothetical protein [Bacillus sp. sid0103]